MVFNETEIRTICKLMSFLHEGGYLAEATRYENHRGITDCDVRAGLLLTEYSAFDDGYGCLWVEEESTVLPWLALTDPEAHAQQVERKFLAAKEAEQVRRETARQLKEAEELAQLRALREKYPDV